MTERRQVALVTGGARRMGRRIVERLAAAGWAVGIHYGSSAAEADALVALVQAQGGAAAALQADLADPAAVMALPGQVAERLGPPRLLVNNASLFEYDTVEDVTPAGLDRLLAVNLQAPVLLASAFAKVCALDNDPVIVNLLDQKIVNLNPDFFCYTVSKGGLYAATQVLACALEGRVRVHGVAPGLSLPSADQTEAEFQQAHRMAPLGRGSTPDDIASAILFIAAVPGYASDLLVVDGGQHLCPSRRDVMYVVRGET